MNIFIKRKPVNFKLPLSAFTCISFSFYSYLFLLLFLEPLCLGSGWDNRDGVFGQGQSVDEISGHDGEDETNRDADAMHHSGGEQRQSQSQNELEMGDNG